MPAKKQPTDSELVEMVAERFGITMAPAGGRAFDVALPDRGLRVQIEMRVYHEATREERMSFRAEALALISDPNEGAWRDQCACSTKKKARYNKHYGSCSKPVMGVVVYKSPQGTWDGRRYDPTKPAYTYSFRCSTHMDTPGVDERRAVYRDTFLHAAREAREERTAALKERERLSKMTPVERIAEDVRMEKRPGAKALATEIESQIRHSYRCDRFRTDDQKLRLSQHGDPSKSCTCGAGSALAESLKPTTAVVVQEEPS